MCGRYTLSDPGDLLTELGVEPTEEASEPPASSKPPGLSFTRYRDEIRGHHAMLDGRRRSTTALEEKYP